MKHAVLSKRSFFYRTNDRKVKGLSWKDNEDLDYSIRSCPHSISISKRTVERVTQMDCTVQVDIYYKPQGTKNDPIFKGTFKIKSDSLARWRDVNGYYITHAGNEILAVPVVLWKQTKEAIPSHIPQLKLL